MAGDRPFLTGAFHTSDLSPTPLRDHRLAASSWIEAPDRLLHLGDELDEPVEYKRRIGRFLLWRAGPAVGEARYLAVDPDSGEIITFDLHGKTGLGHGPDGSRHTRFRTWKESLLGRVQS
ncbi:MAG TPA: hypothetical protein DCY40_10040 [Actinobacteria bacterium]|nr:hypothetical protein [Actinomycetota bacterium]